MEKLQDVKVGEIVAVAQSYEDAGYHICKYAGKEIYIAKANEEPIMVATAGWKNKMYVKPEYMPERIRIKGIRIERLQDISEEDCLKEGIRKSATDNVIGYPFGVRFNYYFGEDKKGCRYATPREAYAALIDRVSGKGTWERNPYVVVYDYELVK